MSVESAVGFRGVEPFFREVGSGPGVVCIHSNASTSGQWRGLMQLLAPGFRVLAPDLYDAGNGPRWPSDRIIRLRNESALIEPVLARAGSSFALVGHSYGAAVALIAAMANPGRVEAMALYEPPLFALLDPDTEEAEEIRCVLAYATAALDAGSTDAAAECFLEYWGGAGAWAQTPAEHRQPIAMSITKLRRWAYALFNETASLESIRSLDVPVLYMMGERSTRSARAVAHRLVDALPRVELVELEHIGHMGPVTHPEVVNEVIKRFLERHRRGTTGRGSDGGPAERKPVRRCRAIAPSATADCGRRGRGRLPAHLAGRARPSHCAEPQETRSAGLFELPPGGPHVGNPSA